MSKEALVKEIHKSSRKNFKRRKVIQKGLNETWQIDLVEMIPYHKANQGFKYILTIIDIFSKYAYAIPIKNKNASNVVEAMKKALKKSKFGPPKNIHSDQGKEFFNKEFQGLMTKFKINHYHTYTKMKASIVERFNRTLKNRMWPKFNLQGSYKWISILDELVANYNNSTHRTIKMKPIDVSFKNEQRLLETVYNRMKIFRFGKFRKGDFVRISKDKGIFAKSYLPNWSTEVFKVEKIKMSNPVTYVLSDLNENIISGNFYEEEMQKTKLKDTYLVEKVLKKNKSKLFVKWLGFDDSHNSWINETDLV